MDNLSIIRPRLNDFHNIAFGQDDVDFVIPFINEDIPFFIDPFLLWKSPSQQDNALHTNLLNYFNYFGKEYIKGNSEVVTTLIECSECNEVGLGNSKTRFGKKIGEKTAKEILDIFKTVPELAENGFIHFEVIQLLVENIAEDRISDFTANFIKSFLIDYTIDNCQKLGIPMEEVSISYLSNKDFKFTSETVTLPINPDNKSPILFVPKRWVRKSIFINLSAYSKEFFTPKVLKAGEKEDRVKILQFNRENYGMVQSFVKEIERVHANCKNDPLFKAIPILSAKRKLNEILKLPTGKTENADIKYENNLCPLLTSMLYPHLDFAQEQSRTESGKSIRDLVFYNNCSTPFLREIYKLYDSTQIVFELKNVKELTNDHVDQLNRYLKNSFGKFGILFTRNPPPNKVLKNTIDLWSGQRKCILILTDEDLKFTGQVFESKNRLPIEVINKKYAEFNRLLPT